MGEVYSSLTAAQQLYVTRRSSVNTSLRHLVEGGSEGLDQDVLVGLTRHKPGRIGDQSPVALGVQSHRQGDGVLRPVGTSGRRRVVGVGGWAGAASPLRAIKSGIAGRRFACRHRSGPLHVFT